MKIRSKLLMFTASAALFANIAHAAIDAQALADSYLADGYTFVEVKTGPTQTKLEAIKDTTKVEVIYDNATGEIIGKEVEAADADEIGRVGVQIRSEDEDFKDDDSDDNSDDSDDDSDDDNDEDEDDDNDDDHDEDDDDEEDDDDDSGQGGGDDDDDNSGKD